MKLALVLLIAPTTSSLVQNLPKKYLFHPHLKVKIKLELGPTQTLLIILLVSCLGCIKVVRPTGVVFALPLRDDEVLMKEVFDARINSSPCVADLTVMVSDEERSSAKLRTPTIKNVVKIIEDYGVVLLKSAWAADSELLDPILESLDKHFKALTDRLQSHSLSATDSFGFNEIVHRSAGRYDMSLAGIEQKSAGSQIITFLLQSPLWRQVLTQLLGRDFKINFTAALLAQPGASEQKPHLDGGHLFHGTHGWSTDAPVHALQMFLPLCPTPIERGPTEFWPGSHLSSNAPFANSMKSIGLAADPGDVIIFDFRVLHRGMANKSEQWRPVLYQTVSRSWFSDDFNFPRASISDICTEVVPKYDEGGPGTRAGFQ